MTLVVKRQQSNSKTANYVVRRQPTTTDDSQSQLQTPSQRHNHLSLGPARLAFIGSKTQPFYDHVHRWYRQLRITAVVTRL